MIKKVIAKPTTFDAVTYNGYNLIELEHFCGDNIWLLHCVEEPKAKVLVDALNEWIPLYKDSTIARDAGGYFSVYKREDFLRLFTEV